MARKRLGELLLERGVITRTQLEQALTFQRRSGSRLGAALVALGALTEMQLCNALAAGLGLKAVTMPPQSVDWTALHTLRARFCEANDLFPLSVHSQPGRKMLTVAMADPLNLPAIEEIEFTTGMKVIPVIAPLSGIRSAIRQHYFKQHDDPHPDEPEKMTIIRPGGLEQVVDTEARPSAKAAGEPKRARGGEGGWSEPTERTKLADLVRQRAERARRKGGAARDLDILLGGAATPEEQLEKMESKFWALLRIMAKKGLLTREEFLREFGEDGEE